MSATAAAVNVTATRTDAVNTLFDSAARTGDNAGRPARKHLVVNDSAVDIYVYAEGLHDTADYLTLKSKESIPLESESITKVQVWSSNGAAAVRHTILAD